MRLTGRPPRILLLGCVTASSFLMEHAASFTAKLQLTRGRQPRRALVLGQNPQTAKTRPQASVFTDFCADRDADAR